jgi:hypothetical protein
VGRLVPNDDLSPVLELQVPTVGLQLMTEGEEVDADQCQDLCPREKASSSARWAENFFVV